MRWKELDAKEVIGWMGIHLLLWMKVVAKAIIGW